MKYTRKKLIAQIQNGEQFKYLFFWGNQKRRDGQIGASSLSQWWEDWSFEKEGISYTTAEHWMMAEKARLFNDEKTLARILSCKTPGEAKKLGRQVQGFKGPKWDAHKYEIVKQGNLLKFGQHQALKDYLLTTQNRILVEASPLDRIWGIGLAKDQADAYNPVKWKGDNLLGFALMEVREELSE